MRTIRRNHAPKIQNVWIFKIYITLSCTQWGSEASRRSYMSYFNSKINSMNPGLCFFLPPPLPLIAKYSARVLCDIVTKTCCIGTVTQKTHNSAWLTSNLHVQIGGVCNSHHLEGLPEKIQHVLDGREFLLPHSSSRIYPREPLVIFNLLIKPRSNLE